MYAYPYSQPTTSAAALMATSAVPYLGRAPVDNTSGWSHNILNQPHLNTAPLTTAAASSSFMFGAAQDTQPIRRSLLVGSQAAASSSSSHENHALVQPTYLARAVDVQQRSQDNIGWYQPTDMQSQYQQQQNKSLQLDNTYGSTNKYAAVPELPYAAYQQKDLSMPRVESLFVSVPRSFELPSLPVYVEATSFSCAATLGEGQFSMKSIWNQVRTNLDDEEDAFVAEEKPYQLTCVKSCSLSCTEFNVRCYSGHYASAENGVVPAAPSGSAYMTIEFQRRTGCSMGVMFEFKRVMRHVSTLVAVESKISMEEVVPVPGEGIEAENGCGDMSDIDMAALAMPTLSRSSTNAANITPSPCSIKSPDSSLYDSIMDMICSASGADQIQGMNSLALCLDGSNPACSAALLKEIGAKLEGAECVRVREAAAKVIAKAAQIPSASSAVVQHCLPKVLNTFLATAKNGACASPLSEVFTQETQKHLLRSCVSLGSAVPHALDSEGSALACGRLRRELLRVSAATTDAEMRDLANQTMAVI